MTWSPCRWYFSFGPNGPGKNPRSPRGTKASGPVHFEGQSPNTTASPAAAATTTHRAAPRARCAASASTTSTGTIHTQW
jgi:hypothetical protein